MPRICSNCQYFENGYCYRKNEKKDDHDTCQRWELTGGPLPFTDPLPDNYVSDGDGWE